MTTAIEDIESKVLYWDDLPVGASYLTPSRTITEADVGAFAGLTADFNSLHVDDVYARSTLFGQRVAHGLLVACVSVGLVTRSRVHQFMEKAQIAVLENKLQFPSPTFIGDTVTVRVEVLEQRETKKKERGILIVRRLTTKQTGEVVVDSTVAMLMHRKPE
ncbi:acyl dehydratase [Diaphorobacter sp. HDW4A]|uniref:MaoC family dehydratase n=1 Tax=Diaphorobacter sp. HDW4A TaxID=2714924 RepID=UPI00140AC467|nr:MaoC/PaaZ C-terminal domain-containing protein [Diaphorobacter sp. HDW4A]QIL80028.1 acyl dehydratase [Diaphorobacter sp. HDW4A]